MAKNIHRSNHNAHAAEMGRFLVWAKNNPKEAWRQAQEERKVNPWKLRALRSRPESEASKRIKEVHLVSLVEAQAEVAASKGPAKLAAQSRLRVARQCYSQIETELSPRPRRHR